MFYAKGYSLKLQARNIFWPVRMHRRLLDTLLDVFFHPRFEGAWVREILELLYILFVFSIGYIGAQVVGNWALLLLLLYPIGMLTVIGGETPLKVGSPVITSEGAELSDDTVLLTEDPFKRAVYLLTIQNGILYGLLMGIVVSVLVKDEGAMGEWIALGLFTLSMLLHLVIRLIPRRAY
jgi:hypothetical protein